MKSNEAPFARLAISLCLAGIAAACEDGSTRVTGDDDDVDGGTDTLSDTGDSDSDSDTDSSTGYSSGCQALDILFVIDDSGTMASEQQMLVDAFPGFIDVLESYETTLGTQLEYRVGVTTTGVSAHYYIDGLPGAVTLYGRDGELVQPEGEESPWIDGPGSDVATVFADAALVGTYGPSYEMPLQAMRLAIEESGPGGANEGFLRDDALFAVVIITDEDDCSRLDDYWTMPPEDHSCFDYPVEHNVVDVAEYKTFLDAAFGGEGRYVAIVVAGMPPPDGVAPCSYGEDGAAAAGRLRAFVVDQVNASADHGVIHDICEAQSTGDMAQALAEAMDLIAVACDEFVPE